MMIKQNHLNVYRKEANALKGAYFEVYPVPCCLAFQAIIRKSTTP